MVLLFNSYAIISHRKPVHVALFCTRDMYLGQFRFLLKLNGIFDKVLKQPYHLRFIGLNNRQIIVGYQGSIPGYQLLKI